MATSAEIKEAFRAWDINGAGVIKRSALAQVMQELDPNLSKADLDSIMELSGAKEDNDTVFYDRFVDNLISPATGQDGEALISNRTPVRPPKEPTLIDNTLLFLPISATNDLGLEPNMDDKGDKRKQMWYGRVWELRELLAARYRQKLSAAMKSSEGRLTPERQAEIDEAMADEASRKRLKRMAAHWKGAVYRLHCDLHILNRLRWSNIKGIMVYCHGSGGCSWDNFRICRMIARMGVLVIAPDGFAYPKNTAMGQIRHKDLLPLKKATDDTDYWAGDLMYSSGSEGSHTYSTKAESVLGDPDHYRELYEKCYQLRRSELHFVISKLPRWIKAHGFFLGGTSEGAMTVSRFDDQRYGEMVMGRFINSYSVEYCYFTPNKEDGEFGGQLDVPTLNIIGTKDQYFGPEDSVAKIVVDDAVTGYGDKELTGNAYSTMVRQGIECGLVCILEDGVHSPCNTHDNFLRQLFQHFFSRPASIWELDAIWEVDPGLRELINVQDATSKQTRSACNVLKVFVPRMRYPQKMSLAEVEMKRYSKSAQAKIAALMAEEAKTVSAEQAETKKMLDEIRKKCSAKGGGTGFHAELAETNKKNYYADDKFTNVKHKGRHG